MNCQAFIILKCLQIKCDPKPTVNLMPFSDLKPLTAKCAHRVWQKEWDEAFMVSNRLHEVLPKLQTS